MKNYKVNFKRNRFKNSNERSFKRNGNGRNFNNNYSDLTDFKRKKVSRNNSNASKLVEKYTELAKEALSNGDKIMSENYYQYADHFVRILEKSNIIKDTNDDLNSNNISSDKDKEQNL